MAAAPPIRNEVIPSQDFLIHTNGFVERKKGSKKLWIKLEEMILVLVAAGKSIKSAVWANYLWKR